MVHHAMGPGDGLLSDDPKDAGQGVLEASFGVLAKDVIARREEALHLGVAFVNELDDGVRPSKGKELNDAPKRNVVAYDKVMEER